MEQLLQKVYKEECRSFISIIVPWYHFFNRCSSSVCRSFISIIVPSYKPIFKLNGQQLCRSFISIIVPLCRIERETYLRFVSILYKYHSSLEAIHASFWVLDQCRSFISIIVPFPNLGKKIKEVFNSCRSFISIIVPIMKWSMHTMNALLVSILYKYHSSLDSCVSRMARRRSVDPL